MIFSVSKTTGSSVRFMYGGLPLKSLTGGEDLYHLPKPLRFYKVLEESLAAESKIGEVVECDAMTCPYRIA